MFVKSISGALLVCLALAIVCVESGQIEAISKLNEFLDYADNLSPLNGANLTAKLAIVAREEKSKASTLSLFEGDLTTAIERFLIVSSAKNCTLEFVNAIGYLLTDLRSQTKVNKLLSEHYWTREMRKQCVDSLANLAKEFVSQLPKDDAMQVYLRHVSHTKFGSKFNPFKDDFYINYHKLQAPIVDELLAIANEKSIVLVESKRNSISGKVESKPNEQQLNYLLETYYAKPCARHLELGANFMKFIKLLQRNQPINLMPIRVWSIAYRSKACKVYQGIGPDNTMPAIRQQIIEQYSKAHPAITLKHDGLLLSMA